uniref:Sulfatase domain-containing protein n=1 Tax=Panagrellus redivivus TaxID=6233 RepID=A0A7E5A0W4_PANRE
MPVFSKHEHQHHDIDLDGQISHYRVIDCSNKTAQPPLVTQLRNGEILVGRPHQSPIRSFKCAYAEMTGTIYPRHRTVTLGKWTNLPIGKRIFIQKDQFVIKCFAKGQLVFHNSFVWISDKPRLNPFSVKAPTKYNIAIFTIDSTSRNQFRRHLPLTMKVMAESGFEHFTGFTKIGDNSAINLLPILTGRVFGAGSRSLVGLVSNDSFYEQKNADFSTFKDSLIAQAREAGCATLWNDEIGQTGMGLFHYYNFGGFRKPVADYYYRPFYEYGMQKFNGMFGCDHQDQFLPKWVNIFEQFSTKYADRCHFSFNFITTLTHGSANNAELFDVPLSEALTRMKAAGVLDNTVIVLQGDHGQRISWIQRRYVGRIEERMSQMSIHLPDKFKTEYPEAYENFVKNSNRLTSNFDVYETLQDIMDKTLEKTTKRTEKHGRSLFTEIPKNRTCQDAMIPENFCVCMEKSPNKVQMAKFTKDISPLIQTRLSETLDPTCMKDFSIDLNDDYQYYTVSKKVRAGQRYPSHKYNADVAREINEIEVKGKLTINLKNGKSISGSITTRVQANSARSELKINASPLVRFEQCPSIFAPEFLCSCQT